MVTKELKVTKGIKEIRAKRETMVTKEKKDSKAIKVVKATKELLVHNNLV